MKPSILTATLIVATMVTTGCSKSDTSTPSTPDSYEISTTEVRFGATDERSSKTKASSILDDTSFDEFQVVAYYYSDDDADPIKYGTATVTKTNGNWSSSSTMFWPVDGTLQFFAYSPGTGVTYTDADANGLPKIGFTPKTSVSEQIDFITSQTEKLPLSTTPVDFKFTHQLSQMAFYANYEGTQNQEVVIKKIVVNGVKTYESGQFSYKDGETSFDWDSTSEPTSPTYTVSQDAEELISTDASLPYYDGTNSSGTDDYKLISTEPKGILLIYPYAYSENDITIVVTYSVDDGADQTQTVQFAAHTTEKEKRTKYQFTVKID